MFFCHLVLFFFDQLTNLSVTYGDNLLLTLVVYAVFLTRQIYTSFWNEGFLLLLIKIPGKAMSFFATLNRTQTYITFPFFITFATQNK